MLQEVTLDGILLKDLLADVASNLAAVPKFQQVGSITQFFSMMYRYKGPRRASPLLIKVEYQNLCFVEIIITRFMKPFISKTQSGVKTTRRV